MIQETPNWRPLDPTIWSRFQTPLRPNPSRDRCRRRNRLKELKGRENPLKAKNTSKAILDAVASQRRRGETALIVRIEPNLIQEAIDALPEYRKVFAPFVPGRTDLSPIYEAYERVQQEEGTEQSVLLLVQCRTTQEFRDAIPPLQTSRTRSR